MASSSPLSSYPSSFLPFSSPSSSLPAPSEVSESDSVRRRTLFARTSARGRLTLTQTHASPMDEFDTTHAHDGVMESSSTSLSSASGQLTDHVAHPPRAEQLPYAEDEENPYEEDFQQVDEEEEQEQEQEDELEDEEAEQRGQEEEEEEEEEEEQEEQDNIDTVENEFIDTAADNHDDGDDVVESIPTVDSHLVTVASSPSSSPSSSSSSTGGFRFQFARVQTTLAELTPSIMPHLQADEVVIPANRKPTEPTVANAISPIHTIEEEDDDAVANELDDDNEQPIDSKMHVSGAELHTDVPPSVAKAGVQEEYTEEVMDRAIESIDSVADANQYLTSLPEPEDNGTTGEDTSLFPNAETLPVTSSSPSPSHISASSSNSAPAPFSFSSSSSSSSSIVYPSSPTSVSSTRCVDADVDCDSGRDFDGMHMDYAELIAEAMVESEGGSRATTTDGQVRVKTPNLVGPTKKITKTTVAGTKPTKMAPTATKATAVTTTTHKTAPLKANTSAPAGGVVDNKSHKPSPSSSSSSSMKSIPPFSPYTIPPAYLKRSISPVKRTSTPTSSTKSAKPSNSPASPMASVKASTSSLRTIHRPPSIVSTIASPSFSPSSPSASPGGKDLSPLKLPAPVRSPPVPPLKRSSSLGSSSSVGVTKLSVSTSVMQQRRSHTSSPSSSVSAVTPLSPSSPMSPGLVSSSSQTRLRRVPSESRLAPLSPTTQPYSNTNSNTNTNKSMNANMNINTNASASIGTRPQSMTSNDTNEARSSLMMTTSASAPNLERVDSEEPPASVTTTTTTTGTTTTTTMPSSSLADSIPVPSPLTQLLLQSQSQTSWEADPEQNIISMKEAKQLFTLIDGLLPIMHQGHSHDHTMAESTAASSSSSTSSLSSPSSSTSSSSSSSSLSSSSSCSSSPIDLFTRLASASEYATRVAQQSKMDAEAQVQATKEPTTHEDTNDNVNQTFDLPASSSATATLPTGNNTGDSSDSSVGGNVARSSSPTRPRQRLPPLGPTAWNIGQSIVSSLSHYRGQPTPASKVKLTVTPPTGTPFQRHYAKMSNGSGVKGFGTTTIRA